MELGLTIAGLFGTMFGAAVWVRQKTLETLRKGDGSRRLYAKELRQGRFLPNLQGDRFGEAEYRERLGRGLAVVDRVLGPKLLFSVRGFGVCFAAAVLYGLLVYFLTWLFNAPTAIGVDVLPAGWPTWKRVVLGVCREKGWAGDRQGEGAVYLVGHGEGVSSVRHRSASSSAA